jgi:hypothetical protein
MNKIKEYVENLPIIEFTDKHNKTDFFTICPVCHDKYLAHIPYVSIACGKCKTTYTTDFKVSMYQKRLYNIFWCLAKKGGFVIYAHNKYYSDMLVIKNLFEEIKSFDIFKPIQIELSHKRCTKCGVCNNCYYCNSCKTHFTPEEHLKRLHCPKCKSDDVYHTRFTEAVNKEGKCHCPECDSQNITMTRSEKMSACSLCKSKKLSEKITETYFYLKIKRKKGYL